MTITVPAHLAEGVGSEVAAIHYDDIDDSTIMDFNLLCQKLRVIEEWVQYRANKERGAKTRRERSVLRHSILAGEAENAAKTRRSALRLPIEAGGDTINPAVAEHVAEQAAAEDELLEQQEEASEIRSERASEE